MLRRKTGSARLEAQMSDYRFSESEKVAIWTADGRKCFYDGTPIHYCDLQIDHIVPEGISENKLSELRPFLPANFEINSAENWVTCHQGCNRRKGVILFETKLLLFYLQMAGKRAPRVQRILQSFETARENDGLLSKLAVRIEQGHLSRDAVISAIGEVPKPVQMPFDPWVIAFGVNLFDPLPVDAPQRDPELSDWLIEKLEGDLKAAAAIFRVIDDERSGETVTIRYAFWLFDFDRIRDGIEPCWDVLAIQKYSELFNDPPEELFERTVVPRNHDYRS
jgi:hypothetical protein